MCLRDVLMVPRYLVNFCAVLFHCCPSVCHAKCQDPKRVSYGKSSVFVLGNKDCLECSQCCSLTSCICLRGWTDCINFGKLCPLDKNFIFQQRGQTLLQMIGEQTPPVSRIPYFLMQFPRKLFFFVKRAQYIRPKITVHECEETIQGRKLYEEIRYHYLTFQISKLQMSQSF